MKKYLSFGGGVNSVAMILMLLDQGEKFEAIFIDHGTDWPETYEYLNLFQIWLKNNGHNRITVLKPDVGTIEGKRFDNLYDYYKFKKVFPCSGFRSCSDKFKTVTAQKYVEKPCFMLIGFDFGESRRAKISHRKGIENRFPLIESEINRDGCKQIIIDHGLPVPIKSGCYICPFQSVHQYRELRKEKPDLFCKAEQLENGYINRRKLEGKKPIYIKVKAPLRDMIDEQQSTMFEDELPPCQCGL